MMDAPLYPPAARFEQPARLPAALSTRSSTINEVIADAEGKSMVEAVAPGLIAKVMGGPLAPHADAMPFRALVVFGLVTARELDPIDAQFSQLNARRGMQP